MSDQVWICATCGVESAERDELCPICADERQWVPASGQRWTNLAELALDGHWTHFDEVEPDLFAITVEPIVGIGHSMFCVRVPEGVLLWDPVGYIDDAAVEQIQALGPVLGISSSHPHMFGIHVEWSRALKKVPIYICEPDLEWVRRQDPAIESWSGRLDLAPGLSLHQLGGHFPGSSLVHWSAGAAGAGVLLVSDTIHVNPDRATTTFMRSFPNRIPLSAAVVRRLVAAVEPLEFDRIYDNFAKPIASDAKAAIQRSADRYIGWISGEFDSLT
jgi:hypothetical protein